MRIKGLKGFTLSKAKQEKPEAEDVVIEGTTAEEIADMGKKFNVRQKDMEETAQSLQDLSKSATNSDEDGIAAGPHGPLEELTIDPDDDLDVDLDFDSEIAPVADTAEPPVQTVKLTDEASEAGADAVVLETTDSEEQSEEAEVVLEPADPGDGLTSLFSEEEDEENPLANLINRLPDVTVQELIDDIEEIRGIIKEWQHQ